MLVMQRQAGDRIRIGENVVVKVIEITGNRVQLGIDAPREIKVQLEPAAPGKSAPGESK